MGSISQQPYRTGYEHHALEEFANTDLAQPIGIFEDLGKHVLPLFLSAIELLSLARSNSAWEKLLKHRFEALEKHAFLKTHIEMLPQKDRTFKVVESILLDTFERSKKLVEIVDYLQEFKTMTLEQFPDFIEDLNVVGFCKIFFHRLKPAQKPNETLSSYAVSLRTWIKNTPGISQWESEDFRSLGLTILPQEIGFFKRLWHLDLTVNKLTFLPHCIGNLTQLQNLHLEYNCLKALPESIGKLTQLRRLHLRKNQLGFLPNSIGNLRALQVLHLERNQLTTLPDSTKTLSLLKRLYLHKNQLSYLPECVGNLKSLQVLHLEDNQLTTLPDSIGNLKGLKSLHLHKNQLTHLPDSLGNLNGLKVLHLEDNQLTSLPDSLGNLTQLQYLHLEQNQLTHLPDTFGNLTQLYDVYLNDNQLKTLPESIGNLSGVLSLDLRENPLTALPESIRYLNVPWAREIKTLMEKIQTSTRSKKRKDASHSSIASTKRVRQKLDKE